MPKKTVVLSGFSLFISFAKENNLELSETFINKIQELYDLLLEENKNTNLISKNDLQKLLTRHVADSLMFAVYIQSHSLVKSNANWADIGSGAGFPVIPLCLYFKHMKFFATECRRKRYEFLCLAKQKLDLQNLEIIQGKAENSYLKNMDFVSCRAVGSLEGDFEIAKKIMKKSGHFLTLKSKRIISEIQEKNHKLLKQADIINYKLPEEELDYTLVQINANKLINPNSALEKIML